MGSRGGRNRRLAALAGVAAFAIGCTTATPSTSPTRTTTPLPTDAPPSLAPSPTATPSPTDAPFVAANVKVTLERYAKVPGSPLAVAAPDDSSGRLFVATQEGKIWQVTNGQVDSQPMLDISGRITSGGERGLLGVALHPGFPGDRRIYTDYTDRNGDTVVSSFTLVTGDPGRFDPGSESKLLHVDQPFANHNGGGLVFGPDGFLYVTLGDGGSGGDPFGNGQSLRTLLGKILRIDVDRPSSGQAYGIPADNPFITTAGAKPEIWLYGLRNPWRVSFDRATGDFWIGDVGQNKWEEVDVVRASTGGGENFGWNRMEGFHCYQPSSGCNQSGLTLPITEYGHDQGCTVIGGYVYRGAAFQILHGGYLFTDYCSATIWAIDANTQNRTEPVAVGETTGAPASFGEGADGELYMANLDGTISRVSATSR